MTSAKRDMVDAVLGPRFAELIAGVAEGRGLAETSVEEAIDMGLMSAAEAQGRHLIDVVAFEDDLPRMLAQDGRPARLVPWPVASRRVRAPVRWPSRQGGAIGVVHEPGAIVPGESQELPLPLPVFGQQLTGHGAVGRALRAEESARAAKAVILDRD